MTQKHRYPNSYGLSSIAMRINTSGYAQTTANWGGMSMMIPYLAVCVITFVAGIIVIIRSKNG